MNAQAVVLAPPAPDNGKHFLFVYGTLKKGFGNHTLLSTATFVRTAVLEGFRMKACGRAFPAIFRSPDKYHRVYGEIYEVDEPTLRRTDILEGVGSGFYSRIEETTLTGERVYTYIQDAPSHSYDGIVGGDWRGPETATYPVTLGRDTTYRPYMPQPEVTRVEALYETKVLQPALPNVVWEHGETDPIDEETKTGP